MESIKKIITGIIILFSLVNNFYAQQVPGKTPFLLPYIPEYSPICTAEASRPRYETLRYHPASLYKLLHCRLPSFQNA